MEAYCDEVRCLEDKFYGLELNHIARRYNETADELAKIASGRTTVPRTSTPETCINPPSRSTTRPSPRRPRPSPRYPRLSPRHPRFSPRYPRSPRARHCTSRRSRSSAVGAARQVVRLAGRWEGALPPQPLRRPPAMHLHRRRSETPTRDTLGGLQPSRSASSPCRKRFPARILLADGGGRRH
jgi:hypothetical protein